MEKKQMVTIGVFVVVLGVIGYMAKDLFISSASAPAEAAAQAVAPVAQAPQAASVVTHEEQLTPEQQIAQDEQRQQQMQYIQTVTQTQMLKAQQDLAETNQKIAAAQASTVTDQVKTLSLLGGGGMQTASGQASTEQQAIQQPKAIQYNVVSVSQLQNRWSAVVSNGTTLYTVHAGDVLPQDNSKIVSIDHSGITLEQNGIRTKISMISTI